MGQVFNPYLPSWEYVPDGEPHIFGDRVYVYGSHDSFGAPIFCVNDYVCWSTPVNDLSAWRFEGVIFRRRQDPTNKLGIRSLYAPDVAQGPDGKFYLYYAFDFLGQIGVAVCDTPAGKYEYLGKVRFGDGHIWGTKNGEPFPFDPGILVDDGRVYLYSGFATKVPFVASRYHNLTNEAGVVVELDKDMLTIKEAPVFVAPGVEYEVGTGFEKHAFFEAPSIRKKGDTYYFIYSSTVMHELCYATSKEPTKGFTYQGVIVSNCDMHIATYKPADMPTAYGANNHGSIVRILDKWYIFYHRQTNGSWYSRQGCAEEIHFLEDGTIPQVEITSCGLNGGPLEGKGEYPAYLACNLFTDVPSMYIAGDKYPKVTQDGKDGDEEVGFIGNLMNHATAGFKYFDCKGVKQFAVTARGYGDGTFEVRTEIGGKCLAKLPIQYTNVWETYTTDIDLSDGVHAIYITYVGNGNPQLKSFTLI